MTSFPVVVIPVFNAFSALDACLAALQAHTPNSAKVIIFDDASTDHRIEPMCSDWVLKCEFDAQYYKQTHNRGFPANCNDAMAQVSKHDVVLLNSDTLVTAGWLDAIVECANSDNTIASITPWTNNGEICSFPNFLQSNPVPDDIELVAKAAALLSANYIDIPTGVGFCMYMRRRVIDQIGNFDADTFGKGYGEENDWCLRAARMGWRNVLCNRAYVVHQGSASFSGLGHMPGGENLDRLLARWPTYNELIARFIIDDPIACERARFLDSLRNLERLGPQTDMFSYE